MRGWQEWCEALPNSEDVLSRSTVFVSTAAERLRQAQAALTSVVAAVPEVVGNTMVQTHRRFERSYPEFHQGFNDISGYQQKLLEPCDIHYLRFLILDCQVDVHYHRSGYNVFSCVASDSSNVTDQKKRFAFLLQCRANVNSLAQMHHHRTPLHLLIVNKNEEAALFLIDYTRKTGHSIAYHLQDFYGNTALLLAIKEEQAEVAAAILNEMEKFGSNIGLNVCDVHGKSALDNAFTMRVEKIIIKLIASGAEYHATRNGHETITFQKDFLNPYHLNHLRSLVLEGKVNVHYDQFGFNALSGLASGSLNPDDQKEGFIFLLQCRVNINSSSRMHHHRTPLHLLIIHKHEGVALFLIEHAREKEHFIDFTRQDSDGNTPLLLAIKTMQLAIVFAILNEIKNFYANIGLDLWDVDGRTALDCAVILGQISIIRVLIALEAKPHAVANRFSNIATFDEKVIRSMLKSVNVDPDQVCKDKQGHKILLYKKCLQNKSNVPVIFWPRLYQGILLSAPPLWRPYTYLPPLHPQIDLPISAHRKSKPSF